VTSVFRRPERIARYFMRRCALLLYSSRDRRGDFADHVDGFNNISDRVVRRVGCRLDLANFDSDLIRRPCRLTASFSDRNPKIISFRLRIVTCKISILVSISVPT